MHTGAATYVTITGTQLICLNPCNLNAIFVGQMTGSGSITVYDAATSVTTPIMVAGFSVAQSTSYTLQFPAKNGLYVTVSAGVTITATVGFS